MLTNIEVADYRWCREDEEKYRLWKNKQHIKGRESRNWDKVDAPWPQSPKLSWAVVYNM